MGLSGPWQVSEWPEPDLPESAEPESSREAARQLARASMSHWLGYTSTSSSAACAPRPPEWSHVRSSIVKCSLLRCQVSIVVFSIAVMLCCSCSVHTAQSQIPVPTPTFTKTYSLFYLGTVLRLQLKTWHDALRAESPPSPPPPTKKREGANTKRPPTPPLLQPRL